VKALVIEDDQDVASYLLKGLRESDFVVDHAADGKEGMMMAASEDYDIMIVDRMLPGMDGLSIIKTVRATGNQTPVIILSALGDVDARVEGLRGGGDDYLTKPFSFHELLARIESLIRRNKQTPETETVLKVADLEMDPSGPHRQARGQEHRCAAPGIPPAGIPDAQRRTGGHPHHAAGESVGLSL